MDLKLKSRFNSSALRLENIQALRAVAAIMVALLHAQVSVMGEAAVLGQTFSPWAVVDLSFGVDIFFVISGVVITISSVKLAEARQGMAFFRKRFLRVVPIYWVFTFVQVAATAVAAFVHPVRSSDDILNFKNVLCSLLFIPIDTFSYGPLAAMPVLFVGWSLNFEVLFYFIFGISIFFGGALPVVLGRVIAVVLALVIVGNVSHVAVLPWVFWARPIMVEFAIGILLGYIYLRGFRVSGWIQAVLLIAGLSVWLFVKQSHLEGAPLNPHVTHGWSRVMSGGLGATLIMSAAVLGSWHVRGKFGELLNRLGESSYALYLAHPIIYLVLAFFAERFVPGMSWSWYAVVVLLIVAILFAHMFHVIFERRLLDWLDAKVKFGTTKVEAPIN